MRLVDWSRGQIDGTRRNEILTVFDEMILSKTLQASGASDALGEKEASGNGELVALVGGPAVDVLKETGEGLLLERLLKIFIPNSNEM